MGLAEILERLYNETEKEKFEAKASKKIDLDAGLETDTDSDLEAEIGYFNQENEVEIKINKVKDRLYRQLEDYLAKQLMGHLAKKSELKLALDKELESLVAPQKYADVIQNWTPQYGECDWQQYMMFVDIKRKFEKYIKKIESDRSHSSVEVVPEEIQETQIKEIQVDHSQSNVDIVPEEIKETQPNENKTDPVQSLIQLRLAYETYLRRVIENRIKEMSKNKKYKNYYETIYNVSNDNTEKKKKIDDLLSLLFSEEVVSISDHRLVRLGCLNMLTQQDMSLTMAVAKLKRVVELGEILNSDQSNTMILFQNAMKREITLPRVSVDTKYGRELVREAFSFHLSDHRDGNIFVRAVNRFISAISFGRWSLKSEGQKFSEKVDSTISSPRPGRYRP